MIQNMSQNILTYVVQRKLRCNLLNNILAICWEHKQKQSDGKNKSKPQCI